MQKICKTSKSNYQKIIKRKSQWNKWFLNFSPYLAWLCLNLIIQKLSKSLLYCWNDVWINKSMYILYHLYKDKYYKLANCLTFTWITIRYRFLCVTKRYVVKCETILCVSWSDKSSYIKCCYFWIKFPWYSKWNDWITVWVIPGT